MKRSVMTALLGLLVLGENRNFKGHFSGTPSAVQPRQTALGRSRVARRRKRRAARRGAAVRSWTGR
jgi:hypothetical protein